MSDQLKQFVERILHVNAQYADIFGKGVPGMDGTSAGSVSSADGVTVLHLQRDTTAFAKAVSQGRPVEEVRELANSVEGNLMMCITLGTLSEKDGNGLLDALHALTKEI